MYVIYNISYYILYRLYTLYIIQITSKYYILYITYNVIYILYIYHKPRNSHTYKINWLYFADDWGHHLGSQLVFSPFPWRSSMSSRSLRPGTVGKHKIGFCWMAIHIFFSQSTILKSIFPPLGHLFLSWVLFAFVIHVTKNLSQKPVPKSPSDSSPWEFPQRSQLFSIFWLLNLSIS